MENKKDDKRVVVNLHGGLEGKAAEGKVEVIEKQHYHILTKDVVTKFKTDHIEAFKKYAESFDGEKSIFFTANRAVLCKDVPGINDLEPIAVCELGLTQLAHDLLTDVHDEKYSLVAFENFLRKYKSYLDTDGRDLLGQVSNFTIKKTESIERMKDQKGNYAFAFSRKGKKEDVDFVEQIKITVPLLIGEDVEIVVPFDFGFDYSISGEEVRMYFSLYNYDLKTLFDEATRKHLEKVLGDFDSIPSYWGSKEVKTKDDSWKYLKA